MCLIIVKPADVQIEEDILRSAYYRNADGWGIMALNAKGSPVATRYVPASNSKPAGFQEFLKEYNKRYKDKECAIHFRFRTHGKVDLENCHPYVVSEGVFMMHNGKITIREDEKDKSDSWHYAQLLAPLAEAGWLRHPHFQRIVERDIMNNRLVFLDKQGFVIFNRSQGVEHKGAWYSNDYAWNYPKPIPDWKKDDWEDSNHFYGGHMGYQGRHQPVSDVAVASAQRHRNFIKAVHGLPADQVLYMTNGQKIQLDESGRVKVGYTRWQAGKVVEEPKPVEKVVVGESKSALEEAKKGAALESASVALNKAMAQDEDGNILMHYRGIKQAALEAKEIAEVMAEEDGFSDVNFNEDFPDSIGAWPKLSRDAVIDWAKEEPEMVGEVFYEVMHGGLELEKQLLAEREADEVI